MADTKERVKKVTAELLKIDIGKVQDDSRFVEDLGADSLDLVEMIMALEEAFNISIADEEAENAHRASAGFAQLMNTMPELLEGQPAVLRTVPLRMTMQDQMFSEDWEF